MRSRTHTTFPIGNLALRIGIRSFPLGYAALSEPWIDQAGITAQCAMESSHGSTEKDGIEESEVVRE